MQHKSRNNAWKFNKSLKLVTVMLEKTGTVNITSKVSKWMVLLTVSYNNPWNLKTKSFSLLKMFCRPSFTTVLCKSMTLLITGLLAFYRLWQVCFFFNWTHGKLHRLCRKKSKRNNSLNNGIAKWRYWEEKVKTWRARDEDEEPVKTLSFPLCNDLWHVGA